MASSIVAGSPFVVAVEGNQLEWGVFERAVAKKVLELCVESGRLTPADVAGIDVKVIPPSVALANREEEEKLRQMRHQAGVLSVTTWQQQVGLDPAHEAANFAAEAKRKAELGGGGTGASSESAPPCACEELVSESLTGKIIDALGRHRCYKDGVQVPCNSVAPKKGTPADPPHNHRRGTDREQQPISIILPGKDGKPLLFGKDSETTIQKLFFDPTKKEQPDGFAGMPTDEYLKNIGITAVDEKQFFSILQEVIASLLMSKDVRQFKSEKQFINYVLFRTWSITFAKQIIKNGENEQGWLFPQGETDPNGVPLITAVKTDKSAWETKSIAIPQGLTAYCLKLKKDQKPSEGIKELFMPNANTFVLDCTSGLAAISRTSPPGSRRIGRVRQTIRG